MWHQLKVTQRTTYLRQEINNNDYVDNSVHYNDNNILIVLII